MYECKLAPFIHPIMFHYIQYSDGKYKIVQCRALNCISETIIARRVCLFSVVCLGSVAVCPDKVRRNDQEQCNGRQFENGA